MARVPPTADEFWHEKMQVSRASQELFAAASSRDLGRAVKAVQGMGDPDACNERGLRPLQLGVATGHLGMVCLLVERGADVNACGQKTVPAVVLAAGLGDMEILDVLLKARADLHAASRANGETVWTRAASLGHLECMRRMLDFAGRASALHLQRGRGGRHGDGNTAIHCAAENGHTDVVDLLITRNADVAPKNHEGATPTLLAARGGFQNIVQLLGTPGLNVADRAGCTPLHAAVWRDDQQLVWELLTAKASVDAQKADGTSPTMLAAELGHNGCLRHLLAAKASVHLEDADGRTAFVRALLKAQSVPLGSLLASGADEPAVNEAGWRPPYTELPAGEYERFLQARA